MAALCARSLAGARLLQWPKAALVLIALLSPAAAAPPSTPDTIVVMLDQARLLQLPERAANVVVGNPIVADLSIQPGGLAVITGKSYGLTNIIVTDRKGAVLLEKTVEVSGSGDQTVVVYRNADRETYSCTPICSRRLTLGDAPDFLEKSLAGVVTVNSAATAAGGMASGH
jgi:hypothetical protein